jgi:hypothetical protein
MEGNRADRLAGVALSSAGREERALEDVGAVGDGVRGSRVCCEPASTVRLRVAWRCSSCVGIVDVDALGAYACGIVSGVGLSSD